MPKGVGFQFHTFLTLLIHPVPSKGIYLSDIWDIFQYWNQAENLEIPMANGIFQPLTELFCVTKKWEHEIVKTRNGTIFKGIDYLNPQTKELIDTLNLGIASSQKTQDEAARLFTIIFQGNQEVKGNSII